MDWLPAIFDADQAAPWLMRALVDRALDDFARFLLVLIRLSGLMILGPLLGQSTVPMNVRALLSLGLALIIAPALSGHMERGFERLDRNRDGLLTRDELPAALEERLTDIQQVALLRGDAGLTRGEYLAWASPRLPKEPIGYALIAAGELALGVLLGLGVTILLSGLQLAGQLVDQQAGFSLGEIINPDFDSTGSVSAQALSYLGMTLFIVWEPLGGHLMMLRTLVQTFESLPIGEALVTQSAIELVARLVQEAFVLGIRVAAPMVVIMTLIDLILGFLGHSVPQVNVQAVGFATRASVCLVILVILLSGVPEALYSITERGMEQLREELIFPSAVR